MGMQRFALVISRLPLGIFVLAALLTASSHALAQSATRTAQPDPQQAEKVFNAEQDELQRHSGEVSPPKLQQTEASADKTPLIKLRHVSLVGAHVIPKERLADTYKSYIGRTVSQADLVAIAAGISKIYRDAGYHLSRAIVPAQDLKDDTVIIQIIEGRITDIAVKGADADKFGARTFLEPIKSETPSRLKTLERQLTLLNEQAGLRITDTALEEIGEASGCFRLTVFVKTWRIDTLFAVDNMGSHAVGPWEAFYTSKLNSYLLPGDYVTVNAAAVPNNPNEFGFGRLSYDVPVGPNGVRLGASAWYGDTWPGDYRHQFDTVMPSEGVELRGSFAPIETQKATMRITVLADAGQFRESDEFGTEYNDNVRTLALGMDTSFEDFVRGHNYLSVYLRQGFDVLGATPPGYPLVSHWGADGVFSTINFAFAHYENISGPWSYKLAMAGQLASAPLLISQQFYAGGAVFGRGYDAGEISGDNGVGATAELRYDQQINKNYLSGYQIYAFTDASSVWDHHDDIGTLWLVSAGIGARLYFQDDWQAGVAVAVPVSYSTGTSDHQSTRFLFSLSKYFTLCPGETGWRCI